MRSQTLFPFYLSLYGAVPEDGGVLLIAIFKHSEAGDNSVGLTGIPRGVYVCKILFDGLHHVYKFIN